MNQDFGGDSEKVGARGRRVDRPDASPLQIEGMEPGAVRGDRRDIDSAPADPRRYAGARGPAIRALNDVANRDVPLPSGLRIRSSNVTAVFSFNAFPIAV